MAEEDVLHPVVNLSDLDEPPQTWTEIRQREAELKNLHLNELRALLEYHAYGFQCSRISGRKQVYIDTLQKVLYYTQRGLGNDVAFTENGVICGGPVGPGTIAEDVANAKGLPTWYLTEQVALEKIQPHGSLCSTRDEHTDRPGAKVPCYTIAGGAPSYSDSKENPIKIPHRLPQLTSTANPIVSGSSSAVQRPERPDVTQELLSKTRNTSDNYDNDDENLIRAGTGSATTQRSVEDEHVWHMTAEHIGKAIVASAYSGLRIVPDAFLRPTPFLLATSDEDLLRRLTQNNIASSHVSILTNLHRYSIGPDGARARYYGRGPEWHENSCYWDSIIVSCLFLDAGFTYVDRGSSPRAWEDGLTSIQRAFLDVLRMDWSFFDKKTSIGQRDMFLNLFYRQGRDEGLTPKAGPKGEMDSPAARWNDVAAPFKQFAFQFHQRRQHCECLNRDPHETAPTNVRYITPPYQTTDVEGITVTELLQRWSHCSIRHCESGSKEITNIVHGNLPLRLVLQVTSGTKLLDHASQNVTFSYTRIEPVSGIEVNERITYRWLGGVYCSGAHFRVYWNDSASVAEKVEKLRIYDGIEAAGAIIGNIKPAETSDPMPATWTEHCPPLLFYEQVVQPSPVALEAARSVLAGMVATQSERSVFPQTFLPRRQGMELSTIGMDTLLPRQLPNAILRVEGPSSGLHKSPSKSPGVRRSPRHTRRADDQSASQTSSEDRKRKRDDDQRPPAASDGATKNDNVGTASPSSQTSASERKQRKGTEVLVPRTPSEGGTKGQKTKKGDVKDSPPAPDSGTKADPVNLASSSSEASTKVQKKKKKSSKW